MIDPNICFILFYIFIYCFDIIYFYYSLISPSSGNQKLEIDQSIQEIDKSIKQNHF